MIRLESNCANGQIVSLFYVKIEKFVMNFKRCVF